MCAGLGGIENIINFKNFTDAQTCLAAGLIAAAQNRHEEACILFAKAIKRLKLGLVANCVRCEDLPG